MMKWISSIVLTLGVVTGCTTSRPAAQVSRFQNEPNASVVIRYYSDATSFMLKPEKLEGSFRSLLDKSQILKIAKDEPARDMAVVIIGIFETKQEEDHVMRAWMRPLKQLGFQRTVFLRAGRHMEVQGLPIIDNPSEQPALSGTELAGTPVQP